MGIGQERQRPEVAPAPAPDPESNTLNSVELTMPAVTPGKARREQYRKGFWCHFRIMGLLPFPEVEERRCHGGDSRWVEGPAPP